MKDLNIFIRALLPILLLISFLTSAKPAWFEHRVIVPPEFSNGRSLEGFEGTSDIELYVHNFEKVWWKVVRAFATDSGNWQSHEDFSICSGTPAAHKACIDGYENAKEHIETLVSKYGLEQTRSAAFQRLSP